MTAPRPLMAPVPRTATCSRSRLLSAVDVMCWSQLLRAVADDPAGPPSVRRAARRARRVLRRTRFLSRLREHDTVAVAGPVRPHLEGKVLILLGIMCLLAFRAPGRTGTWRDQ